MIVLLDTNVLLDLALDRTPHAQAAADLLDLLEGRPGSAFVAWHTISNFYHLTAPRRGRASTRTFIADLARFVDVAPTSTESVHLACRLELRDFEDAMQVAAAVASGAEVIATRNERDYARAPIRIATPAALLRELA